MRGLGAAGPEVNEYILSALPKEQAEAARVAVAEGRAQNITHAVGYILDNPSFIAETQKSRYRTAWAVFGGAVLLFSGSLGYYLIERLK